jgi:hypothetical protein
MERTGWWLKIKKNVLNLNHHFDASPYRARASEMLFRLSQFENRAVLDSLELILNSIRLALSELEEFLDHTTPSAPSKEASQLFLGLAATPPLLRRGARITTPLFFTSF